MQNHRWQHLGSMLLAVSLSILREEVLEVVLGQAAGEAFLAQHVTNGLRLALLEFPDFLLNGSGGDEPIGVDGASLADAMGAVYGLRFDGRVPPGIVKHDITGRGQVQSRAGGAKTEQENRGAGIVLEGVDDFLP